VVIIFARKSSLVLALCLLSSFGPSRRCSGGKSPDSQHEFPGYSPSVFHMGIVVDKMTVRQVYLRLFNFCQLSFYQCPQIYIYQPILDSESFKDSCFDRP